MTDNDTNLLGIKTDFRADGESMKLCRLRHLRLFWVKRLSKYDEATAYRLLYIDLPSICKKTSDSKELLSVELVQKIRIHYII